MRATRRETLKGAAATAIVAGGMMGETAKASGGLAGLDYRDHDMLGLADMVRKKQVSPSELLEEAIARTEATDPRFNFMAQKLYDYGRERIARGLPDGLFTGVPFLEKDLHMHIAGTRFGQGSRLYSGEVSSVTSELVKRHEAAGLVIFGKTTTPEFGLTGTTESIAYGPTRNPWNAEHSSGGSSGGASAAVAAGVIPGAHASDGGGSIRIPASACGLVGLKPSRGRVPMGPLRTEGWGGMSTNGAVTRSVRDTAALLDATHGPEPGSRYSAPTPDGTFLAHAGRDPGKLRIALMLDPVSGAPVDGEVKDALRASAKLCEELGHHVEEAQPDIALPGMGEANFALISTALASDLDARAAKLGIAITTDVVEPIVYGFYLYGKSVSGIQVASANVTMQELAVAVARFMQDYDVILSPVMATPPARIGVHDLAKQDFAAWGEAISAYIPFPGMFNATGQPSLSLPLGTSAGGLPIGSMFTGRFGDEATLLSLAGQIERAKPWFGRMPEV